MLTRRHFWPRPRSRVQEFWCARVSLRMPLDLRRHSRIPQLIDAKANANALSLTIAEGTHAYRPGQSVKSFGYSSPVLGPVIRLARGESTDILVENKMSRPTTVHWHGLIVPGQSMAGPTTRLRQARVGRQTCALTSPNVLLGSIRTLMKRPRNRFIPDSPE